MLESDTAGTVLTDPPNKKVKPADSRRVRVRLLRKLLACAVASIALAAFAGLYVPTLFVLALLPTLILVLSFALLLLQKCDVDGDLMYGVMIPLSALFGGKHLGEFGPADVVAAEIVRTRLKGTGTYTSLFVRSRFGDLAGFGGAPDIEEGEMATVTDPALRELLQKKLDEERGDLALGIDWLHAHGIAVGLSTPSGERLRARRYAKWLMLGGLIGAGAILTALYGLMLLGFLNALDIITGAGLAAFALVVCIGAGLHLLDAGVAVWGETIYRSRVPLGALVRPTALGEATAADVRLWRIRRPRFLERRDQERVLEVRFRGSGKGLVYYPSDREGFKAVEGWLESRCPEKRKP